MCCHCLLLGVSAACMVAENQQQWMQLQWQHHGRPWVKVCMCSTLSHFPLLLRTLVHQRHNCTDPIVMATSTYALCLMNPYTKRSIHAGWWQNPLADTTQASKFQYAFVSRADCRVHICLVLNLLHNIILYEIKNWSLLVASHPVDQWNQKAPNSQKSWNLWVIFEYGVLPVLNARMQKASRPTILSKHCILMEWCPVLKHAIETLFSVWVVLLV